MMRTVQQGWMWEQRTLRRESEACGQSSTGSRAWSEQSQMRADADTLTNQIGQTIKFSSEEIFGLKLAL